MTIGSGSGAEMAFDAAAVRDWPFERLEARWEERDTLLYALGLGIGQDPVDPAQLDFVCGPEPKVLPTMAVILGHPGPWLADHRTGVDYRSVVHGENHLEVFAPIPPAGAASCENKVVELIDKGEGKAAIVVVSKTLRDRTSGDLLARQRSSLFLRGHGGFGGATKSNFSASANWHDTGAADATFEWHVPANSALVYRLSGDMNPLHADPAVAQAAGFKRPILHGLALFGMMGWAAVQVCCDGSPDGLKEIGARFAAPVLPGDTLEFAFRRVDEKGVHVSARARERDQIVLTNGMVRVV